MPGLISSQFAHFTITMKTRHALITFLFLMIAMGSTIGANSVGGHAATVTPTATATRIRHVTIKPRATATPAFTATATVTATTTVIVPSATATPVSGLGGSIEATVQAYIDQTRTVTGSQSLSAAVVATNAQPIRLVIPSLKVDTLIETVGRDKDGAMDIPSKVEDVAWYGLGTAPGEVGNAVIAGHLDLVDGSPAVFWNIGKLKVGDEVIVYDADNVAYHFQVTGNQRYQFDGAPVEDIFGFALKSQLNLITCAGTSNRNSRNYSNRLVVYTELVKTVQPKE